MAAILSRPQYVKSAAMGYEEASSTVLNDNQIWTNMMDR